MVRTLVAFLLLVASCAAADLNAAIAKIMHGRSGTAVAVDVPSGRVLGSYHLDVAARRLARPGSAFKPFTLMALLQSGKLKPTDGWTCRRTLRVGTHNLACTHPQSGELQAVSALAYSCNDFFATFGARLTPQELQKAFISAGFSSATGFVTEEATGSIRLARDKGERQLQAIGEGEMRVTPLELLAAYRALALRKTAAYPTEAERTVFAGLEAATEYGMARLASFKGLKVAGKTGTARTDQGWANAWFAGYAPAAQPQVALVVFLERGTGPGDAAPLASEIFQAWKEAR